MKIDYKATIKRSVKNYIEKDISGMELSQSIKENFEQIEGLDKSQTRTFGYYTDFFEKEGKNFYLASNVYLKEEVDELGEFLDKLDLG